MKDNSMAQYLAERSSLSQDSDLSTVREVQVDGNILSSDGQGKMIYDGVDGSHAEIFPDGSATYEGPEGSGVAGEMNIDGSGFWIAPDGSTSSWEAGGKSDTNLPGMDGLSNMDSIANSPEAEEAFGKQVMVHGKGSQFGLLHAFFLKHA
jgi:hypothetical protein